MGVWPSQDPVDSDLSLDSHKVRAWEATAVLPVTHQGEREAFSPILF